MAQVARINASRQWGLEGLQPPRPGERVEYAGCQGIEQRDAQIE
jgi:hypothetical protein